jgi:lysine decarboxylase
MSDGAREPAEQPTAPYLEAITAYGFRGSLRFHVPGHKGGEGADPGLRSALGERALLLDVPQDIEGIDVGPPPTPYERAEQLAADAYGAARAWFLTNGATQGNHALCLALAPPGVRVILQRNSHASLIDGLVLSGGTARFVAPEYDIELGMAHGVTPEALAEAFERAPEAPAAFIVSPTYYGMAADVGGCAEVAHAAGAALIVDCAWGSHFGFHALLPPSPLALGADAMLASTHKIVGSLTQSAMLLVAGTGRVDPEAVARAVRLIRSTSPSALLMASLDAARRQLAVHGEALLDRTIRAAERAREAIEAVPGCAVLDDAFVGRPGIAGWDPLRIVVDVRGTGRTGYDVAAPPTTSTSSWPPTPRSCSCSESASRWRRSSAWPTTSPRRSDKSTPRASAMRSAARPRPCSTKPWSRRAKPSSAAARWYPYRTPWGGSRASRSPAIRPGSRRCCPASGSPTRWSPICAS